MVEKSQKWPLMIGLGVGAALVTLLLLMTLVPFWTTSATIARNRERLEHLEQAPIDQVQVALEEKKLKQQRALVVQAQTDGTLTSQEANAIFDGTVIIGDSLSAAISVYGFLSDDKVIAEIGVSFYSAAPLIERAAQLHPRRVVLSFGENDIEINDGDTGSYLKSLTNAVEQVKNLMPQAQIFITSVLPVSEQAIAVIPELSAWSAFNDTLSAYAADEPTVTYIDTASTALEHLDLFEPDGIHYRSPFYEFYLLTIANGLFQ